MSLAIVSPAVAQKYPGDTLPTGPAPAVAPPVARMPAIMQPASPMMPSAPAGMTGGDAAAERVARNLPLDPATRELRDRLPPNVAGVERTLGLRPPQGHATDLRGQIPTPREIVDALAPK